jgi:hypothetical protein
MRAAGVAEDHPLTRNVSSSTNCGFLSGLKLNKLGFCWILKCG